MEKRFFLWKKESRRGGVISPLLANVALHGLETAIGEAYPESKRINGKRTYGWKPTVIRYADDVRHLTHNEILLAEKGGTEE